ncbi:hypothetical protein [Melghirimyces algeriensis]|uniref:C2H2-type domain-containing protein n=1 Tax=Melghirimyces algeriensis TaxID=910412 RepID=A0A521CU82_9BACL|nr:hypothetical protein [Melghirimyces algeriensis]SMO62220.1 hypothetical protein SAMN06264849_104146 [Melghirimyces algeriensis]
MGLFDDLKHKFEKGIESTGHQSKKMLDISRIKFMVRNEKEKEEALYYKLGKEIFRYWDRKGDLELTDLTRATLQHIQDVRRKIVELEETVEKLKQQHAPVQEKKENSQSIPAPDNRSQPEASEEKRLKKEPVRMEKKNTHTASQTDQTNHQSTHTSTPELSENWAEGKAFFVCPHCGDRIEETTIICSHCHKHIYED